MSIHDASPRLRFRHAVLTFINKASVQAIHTDVVAVGQVQRSVEYSTLSGRYASFLEKDILPIVEADYKISHDPAMRVATGGSEGGICAFAMGWFRPDLFGKVCAEVKRLVEPFLM